jgi:hypothetical protein
VRVTRPVAFRVCAAAALLAAGCATESGATYGDNDPNRPVLRERTARELWFKAPAACGQGPYEIDAATLGWRWGEEVRFGIRSPLLVRMTWTMAIEGDAPEERTWTMSSLENVGTKAPDNAACVASQAEIGRALAAAPAGDAPARAAGATARPHAGGAPQAAADAALLALVPQPPQPVDGPHDLKVQEVLSRSWRSTGFGVPTVAAGLRIRFRFWSAVPNNLKDVYFVVSQVVRQPSVPDDAYVAWLRAEEAREHAEAERERARHPPNVLSAEEIAAQEREAQRQADEAAREAREAELRRQREEERRRQEEIARREQERLWRLHCDQHHEDSACWGPGGFSVRAELDRRRDERNHYCEAHHDEARCWSESEWADRRLSWNGGTRADDATPGRAAQPPAPAKIPEPDGPPPPPRADDQPPRPSDNAEWRPGYWQWTGQIWFWIAGLWRVPDEDIARERTVHAPAAPPPARAETPAPAPPVVAAVWTPGYWQWNGRAFIWIPGSWQLPPGAGVTWRPTRWILRAGGIHVLVPGGWVTAPRP